MESSRYIENLRRAQARHVRRNNAVEPQKPEPEPPVVVQDPEPEPPQPPEPVVLTPVMMPQKARPEPRPTDAQLGEAALKLGAETLRHQEYTTLTHLAASEDARLYRLPGGAWTHDSTAEEAMPGLWVVPSAVLKRMEKPGWIEKSSKAWDSPRRITPAGVVVLRRAKHYLPRRSVWVLGPTETKA